MWKNQGSWNFFHTKLIPNSSILFSQEMTLNNPKKVYNYFPVMFNTSYKLLNIKMLYKNIE